MRILLVRQVLRWSVCACFGALCAFANASDATIEGANRLAQVSTEVRATINWVQDGGSVLAFWKPTASWCADFLRDLLTLSRIEVLDAEYLPQVNLRDRRRGSPDDPPIPAIDPNFRVGSVNGTRLIQGYVSTRWRSKLLLLYVDGSCIGGSPRERVGCKRAAHWLHVRQASEAMHPLENSRCSLSALHVDALPHWKDDVVVIPFDTLRLTSQ